IPGSGDYVATFIIQGSGVGGQGSGEDVLWIPATANGPGQALRAPGKNQAGGGYPIYLSDSTGAVSEAQVTFNYNPALLTVTAVSGPNFTLLPSSTAGQAVLQYSGPVLPVGTEVPIGFVTATVPSGSTANPVPYKAMDLLHLASAALNGGAIPVVTADAVH